MDYAGGIMTCSLIHPKKIEADRFDYIHDFMQKMAGNKRIGFDLAAYLEQKDTKDKHYALAHFMNEKNMFPEGTNMN